MVWPVVAAAVADRLAPISAPQPAIPNANAKAATIADARSVAGIIDNVSVSV
jgi:hypothetical protein